VDKVLEVLKNNDVEVTDELRSQIEDAMPSTDDLLTQQEFDDALDRRLGRERNLHENEIEQKNKQIKQLKEQMEDLVDPEKIEEYETKIEELEKKDQEASNDFKKDYELKLAAAKAGVEDEEYFDFLVEKRGLKDRLKVDDEGNIFATDKEGNIITSEDGKKFGAGKLIDELAEDKPDLIGSKEGGQDIGGDSNPSGSDDTYKSAAELAKDRSNSDKQKSNQKVKDPWNK